MADFQIRINTQSTGDQGKPAAEGIKQVAAESDKATISQGKLAAAAQKLGHEFPALGAAANFLKHPIIGLAAAIAFLTRKIFELIEIQNELAKEAAQDAAAMTLLTRSIDLSRERTLDAAKAKRELADALAAVTEKAKGAEVAMDREIKKIETRLALDKEDIEQKEKLALAELELARVRESMRDEEFEMRKANVQEGFIGLRAGAENAAEAQKQNVMASAHFKAVQAQKDNMAVAEDMAREEANAKKRLDEFDRQEAGASVRRAKELKKAQEEEAAAEGDVALESSPHGVTAALELGDTGPEPLTQARRQREARLAAARKRLASAQEAQRTIAASGQQQAGRRAELASDVEGIAKVRGEAISAAAKQSGLAESTRQGVIQSHEAGGPRNEAARRQADATLEMGELVAQTAGLKQALKEAGELMREAKEEMKRTNQRVQQLHGRQAVAGAREQ